jgi:diguanylate cyclase (GGDEF)-like protein
MNTHDLIALGLSWRRGSAETVPAPASSTTPPPEVSSDGALETLRPAAERLLTLLRDFVAVVELSDQGGLLEAIEICRKVVASSSTVREALEALEACNRACRSVLSELDRQRLEQQEEIATLVDMVREALAIVAGDGQTFNRQLGSSMQRFEALVHISDVKQLKTQLIREVGDLRRIAEERQRLWEDTCQRFTQQVDSLERQLLATKHEASLDALTRVSNRGAFDRACREWAAGAYKEFTLAVIDVDHFKRLNDMHGHSTGDRALVAVAQALRNSVRSKNDIVARIGGDEFAVLIANLSLRQAESRMRMLLASLASTSLTTTGPAVKMTFSCGVAEYSAGDTCESLLERGDAALYEAKQLGRNRVVGKSKPTLHDMMKH